MSATAAAAAAAAAPPINVVHTYRHMLRRLLRAVQHSSPAKYEARDRLRAAFRRPLRELEEGGFSGDAAAAAAGATNADTTTTTTTTAKRVTAAPAGEQTTIFDTLPDAATIKRTLWFLDVAAREAGLEHRIVRNLLQVGWERRNSSKGIRSGTTAAQQ
jgi:hypothetical protein